MRKIIISKIERFLKSGIFCNVHNDYDQAISQLLRLKGETKLIFGETYDDYGLTIDSIKYYFILEILSRLLNADGKKAHPTLLIGDAASINNDNVKDKSGILRQIDRNLETIRKLINDFGLSLKIVRMSDFFKLDKYKKSLKRVNEVSKYNAEIQALLNKTILKNRFKQEKNTGFKYAVEEIAIIRNFEIKIGPPRERYYDKAASIVNNRTKPLGFYVKPTYPLGLNYDYFIDHPEIDKFGVTPYKAGSNKLQKNRLILNKTSLEQIETLIGDSFIPCYDELPNPVLDLYIVCDLAKRIKNANFDFKLQEYSANLDCKKVVINMLNKQFHEYFK